MQLHRRSFLASLAAGAGAALRPRRSEASHGPNPDDGLAVLVDTTRCVGCRRCEQACNESNTQLPRKSKDSFKDPGVFEQRRRMDAAAYTVVNRYQPGGEASAPVFVKFQCMHCLYPACMSACIVGAFSRSPEGAVVYDPWKCIGCRYCMAACPFQVPAYEYHNALTPQVRKCTFCFDTRLSKGKIPACVSACPMEVMRFGRRADLIAQAWQTINDNPRRYHAHVYGEHEAGGTSWLYLAGTPFQNIDFPRLGYHPLPGYTEPVQHALFKWFLPPIGLYSLLGGIMWLLGRRQRTHEQDGHDAP